MVLDASAVVEWLLGSERGDAVVTQLLEDPDGAFFAPDLLDVEVVQAFRRLARSGTVTDVRATGAVELLEALPVERRPAGILVPRHVGVARQSQRVRRGLRCARRSPRLSATHL